MKNGRRRYTAEFKAEAVRFVATSGKPVSEVSRELGINEQTLYRWKRQATSSDGSGVEPGHFGQQEEIRRLRRELDRVTEERDILKKATAFFASQSR
jgi:transposase